MVPLLRFHTLKQPDKWVSLQDYVLTMPAVQSDIYYILGSDTRSVVHSPHLEPIRKRGLDALLMTDPIDPLLLLRMTHYEKASLVNCATKDLKLPDTLPTDTEKPETTEVAQAGQMTEFCQRVQQHLGTKVSTVSLTEQLDESPARLIDPEGAPSPEMQQLFRFMDKKQDLVPKALEINPHHPIIENLAKLPTENPLFDMIIDQIYEDALLIEGLHPDPAGMITRVQQIMQAALKTSDKP
jgi:molecular chaperone HtpG